MKILTKAIICCGFTPCVQRIIEFEKVEKGSVNRAKKVTVGIGGKGANTARMIKQLGQEPVLYEFSGGANGSLLEDLLDDEGIDYRHLEVDGETRVCQTLLESGDPDATELVEEMPPISADDWLRMMDLFKGINFSDKILTISGKLPAGAPVDAYAQLCGLVGEHGGRVILDAQGDPLLLCLKHEPLVVKINEMELMQATGAGNVQAGCGKLLAGGAQSVFITRGCKPAFYMDSKQSFELVPADIVAINPIGSGDAVTAGLATALNARKDILEALVEGMACGAANALNLISGMIRPEDVSRLREQVVLKPFRE